ncbi:MAG: Ig-like domain-containing protein [Thermoplasmata archaeon]
MVKKLACPAMVLCLITGYFAAALPLLMPGAEAHVDPLASPEDPRQIYSFFNGDAASDVIIDGQISRGTSPATEWDGAFVRNITLSDFGSPANTRYAQLLLMNDDDYLYVGLVYKCTSSSSNDYVTLYFDEGAGATAGYDGPHDDRLTDKNENFVKVAGAISSNRRYWDGYYNSSAGGWVYDNNDSGTDKGSWDDFDYAVSVAGPYYNRELKIPLNPKNDSSIESDLNVAGTDELGFFLEVYFHNEGRIYYWDRTGKDPGNVSLYADLQLGVGAQDRTMYATFARSGTPTLDGDITGDFGWADCYTRNIMLTNFRGGGICATVFITQDTAGSNLYFGLMVRDPQPSDSDFLRIYFEQGNSGDGSRNGLLDNSYPNFEQYFEVTGGGAFTDGHINTSTFDATWKSDSGADDVDGNGKVKYVNLPGTASDRYEFEFLVPYNSSSSYMVDADHDLSVQGAALLGMLIRFHDADAPSGQQDYWWDRTANMDQLKTQEYAEGVFVAPGWILLQMGGPWLKLVSPTEGSVVKGSGYIFRVAVDDEDSGTNDVTSVAFQISGQSTWTSLIQQTGTIFWESYWDTTSLPDGRYDITVAARDNDGIVVRRIVSVTVANGDLTGAPPTGVSILQPTGGPLRGSVLVAASASGASGVGVYVDDRMVGTMSWNSGTMRWEYVLDTTCFRDGYHTIRVTAFNAAGSASDAGLFEFDNWHLNTVSILSPSPGANVTNSGLMTFMVDFEDDDSGVRMDILVDGEYLTSDYTTEDLGAGDRGFVVQLDPTVLGDGERFIKAVVYDPDGNPVSDSVVVKVQTRPSLVVIGPGEGDVIGGATTLRVSATDTEGIQSVQYSVDGGAWSRLNPDASAGGLYTSSLNTNALADGTHALIFRAYDNPPEEFLRVCTEVSVRVLVDNTPPSSVSVLSPCDGAYLEGQHTFKVKADDINGISRVRLQVSLPEGRTVTVDSMALSGASGCYEYTLDTELYADGNASATVTACDRAGNTRSSSCQFRIDNNAPVLRVSAPKNGGIVSGLVDVAATMDDAFPDRLEFSVDGGAWCRVTGGAEWDSTGVLDGKHILRVRATDAAGHETIEERSVLVDNQPPSVPAVIQPQAGTYVEGIVVLRVAVSDAVGLAEVCATLSLSSGANHAVERLALNHLTGCHEAALDTRVFPDGETVLNITATDLAGHVSHSITKFRIDNTACRLVVIHPRDGEVVSGELRLLAEVSDLHLDRTEYSVDGNGWFDVSLPLNTTALMDGRHRLDVRALDSAGHETSVSLTIIVDNGLPAGRILRPLPGEFLEGRVRVEALAQDSVGVAEVELGVHRLEGENLTHVQSVTMAQISGERYETELLCAGLPDFTYALILRVTDVAGHVVQTAAVPVSVDGHAPVLRVLSPGEGAVVYGEVALEAEVRDEGGIFLEPTCYSIDGSAWVPIGVPWNTFVVADGQHTLAVRAADSAGHETIWCVSVTVDNSVPIVTVARPRALETVEGEILIEAVASDGAGIARVEVLFNGSEHSCVLEGARWRCPIYTTELPDGEHVIEVRARDLAGRSALVVFTVRVDNRPPTLALASPRINDYLCGTVVVEASAADAFLQKVEYSVDGLPWSDISRELDTTLLEAGRHILRVRALDAAGHEALVELPVFVDNAEPVFGLHSPAEGVYVSGETALTIWTEDDLGVVSVELSLGDRSWRASPTRTPGRWEALVNTALLEGYEHNLTVLVRDRAGKTTSGAVLLRVDNVAPAIRLETRTELVGRCSVVFSINDRNRVVSYEYRVDGGAWRELLFTPSKGNYEFLWSTGVADNGEHRVDVRAVDELGNTALASFRVRVSNPDLSWVVYLLLVLLVVAAASVLLYRRRTRATELPAGPDEGPARPSPLPPPEEGSDGHGKKKPLPSSTADSDEEAGEIEQESSISGLPLFSMKKGEKEYKE